jgi:hypothetical protein
MGIKDKVKTLTDGLEPYFKPVFVFTSAKVDALWGTTRSVHCVRDEQLFDYTVEAKKGKILPAKEVEAIAQAFLGLAHMDADFTAKAAAIGRVRVAAIVGRAENRRPHALTPAVRFSRVAT